MKLKIDSKIIVFSMIAFLSLLILFSICILLLRCVFHNELLAALICLLITIISFVIGTERIKDKKDE